VPAIDSGGAAACRSRGRREAIPKPVSLTSSVARFRSDRDGEAQKAPHLHGHSEQSVQRLAAGVLEHQHGPTAFPDELDRSHRPGRVQLVLQSVFTGKAIEGGRCRMLRGGQHNQRGDRITVDVALSPTEDAFAILPQNLQVTISTSAGPGWIHVEESAVRSWPPRAAKAIPGGRRNPKPTTHEAA
jgi:hypothetical protein